MTQLNSLLSPINELMVRKIPKYNWEQIDKFYGKKKTKSLIHYADKLKKTLGKKNIEIWTFNSATSGGGVADLLDALLSLSKKHGINWHWFVIKGNSAFFNSTKIFHNVLHGNKKIKITNQILKNYLQGTRSNVRGLQRVLLKSAHTEKIKIPDIVLVHDPQPLALFPLFKKYYPQLFKKYFAKTIFIWQSHIPFNLSSRVNWVDF